MKEVSKTRGGAGGDAVGRDDEASGNEGREASSDDADGKDAKEKHLPFG